MEGWEWIIVGAVVLLMFGGSQIPKLARSLGQAQKEFKQGLKDGASDDEEADTDEASSKKAAPKKAKKPE
jgi:sec-independent protein translocase protein TatA